MAPLETSDRAENEKNVFWKHLDGKALFTGMLRLYAGIHREMKEFLLLHGTKVKEDCTPKQTSEEEQRL
jgi:hypothetical protein